MHVREATLEWATHGSAAAGSLNGRLCKSWAKRQFSELGAGFDSVRGANLPYSVPARAGHTLVPARAGMTRFSARAGLILRSSRQFQLVWRGPITTVSGLLRISSWRIRNCTPNTVTDGAFRSPRSFTMVLRDRTAFLLFLRSSHLQNCLSVSLEPTMTRRAPENVRCTEFVPQKPKSLRREGLLSHRP